MLSLNTSWRLIDSFIKSGTLNLPAAHLDQLLRSGFGLLPVESFCLKIKRAPFLLLTEHFSFIFLIFDSINLVKQRLEQQRISHHYLKRVSASNTTLL